MSGIVKPQQDEEIQACLHKLERENRILRKKIARSEANQEALEEAKDQYDTVFQSVIRKLDQQTELLGQKNQELQAAYAVINKQKERMQGELNVGRDIQMSMVPDTFPAFPDHDEFDIHALLKPAREIGGDFYDYFFIERDKLCVCVGDVSGKGVPAALFMAVTKTMIKSTTNEDHSPASIITRVNHEISQDNPSCMFITLFLGILHVRSGEFHYTNAGHPYPYVKRAGGVIDTLKQVHGPVVGAVDGMAYGEDSIILGKDDQLLIFTLC